MKNSKIIELLFEVDTLCKKGFPEAFMDALGLSDEDKFFHGVELFVNNSELAFGFNYDMGSEYDCGSGVDTKTPKEVKTALKSLKEKEVKTSLDIEVEYTGGGEYSLCLGSWRISFNDIEIDTQNFGEMDTFGEYSTWSFEDGYFEEWTNEENGLHEDEWIVSETAEKIYEKALEKGFSLTEADKRDLFKKIQSHDWRHMSCGGCI